jgi:hypothetical protein
MLGDATGSHANAVLILPDNNRDPTDSPLEGGGFELSVPREVAFASPRHPEPSHGGSVSKVQPTGIKQVASSSDISTMRSSPMAIWAR